MKPFTQTQELLLAGLAFFGFIVPNGVFLYYTFMASGVLLAALTNPVALVFIVEAFILLPIFAWLIHRQGYRSPGWFAFVVMSIIGSMVFSVPAFLYLVSRKGTKAAPSK